MTEATFDLGTRVRMASLPRYHRGELALGDTGTVVSGLMITNILVAWDKDKMLRLVNRKRLEPIPTGSGE